MSRSRSLISIIRSVQDRNQKNQAWLRGGVVGTEGMWLMKFLKKYEIIISGKLIFDNGGDMKRFSNFFAANAIFMTPSLVKAKNIRCVSAIISSAILAM